MAYIMLSSVSVEFESLRFNSSLLSHELTMDKAEMIDEKIIKRIFDNEKQYQIWAGAAKAILKDGSNEDLRQLLLFRSKRGLSGAQLAFDTICYLLQERDFIRVTSFYKDMEPNDPFSGFYCIGQSFVDFLNYDIDKGYKLFLEGIKRYSLLKVTYPQEKLLDEDFFHLLSVAFLFEEKDYGCRCVGEINKINIFFSNFTYNCPAYACSFFCDSTYLKLYGERFIEGFRSNCGDFPVFVGIVNPDEEIKEYGIWLGEKYENIVLAEVPYSGEYLSEYSAAIRFIYANEIIKFLNCPVVFFDADAVFPENSKEVFLQIATYPLSYINTQSYLPTLTMSASLVGAHPGKESQRFFKDMQVYLLKKAGEVGPLWTFDQVALHIAVSKARERGANIVDLGASFPLAIQFPDFFTTEHKIGFDERFRLRKSNRVYLVRLDALGKPIYQKTSNSL